MASNDSPLPDVSSGDSIEIIDIASDSESDSEKGDEEKGPWSELPALCVENIYNLLGRSDQYRMSLVCRNWSKEFSSPCLWRTMKFCLPEYDLISEICPEVKFAMKYGIMFQRVEIICKRVRSNLLSLISEQLKLFLHEIMKSNLNWIKFTNMGNYFRFLADFTREDVFLSIVVFLQSQRRLRSVNFEDCHFTPLEAVQILDNLFANNEGTLRELKLGGFVRESSDEIFEMYLSCTDVLSHLRTLETNYSQIFEKIVTGILDYTRDNYPTDRRNKPWALSEIKLSCGTRRSSYIGITSNSWRDMRKLCPELKVDLWLKTGSHVRSNMQFFLVDDMPLRFLYCTAERSHSPNDTEIGILLKHLVDCGAQGFLEELNVVWSLPSTNLVEDLQSFLQACCRLKVLQIYVKHPVNRLETLFPSLIENRPHVLETIQITVSGIATAEAASHYSEMADEYAPLLQVCGINMFLIAEYPRY